MQCARCATATPSSCRPAQVALALDMQLGHTVISASTCRKNLQGNFSSPKLDLTDKNMSRIVKLDWGKRLVDPAGLKLIRD